MEELNYKIIEKINDKTFEGKIEAVTIEVLGKKYTIRGDQDPQEVANEIIKNQTENEQVIP